MICQSLRWMQEAGRCSTMRRTEDSTQAPTGEVMISRTVVSAEERREQHQRA
jgi:hypothetical protein